MTLTYRRSEQIYAEHLKPSAHYALADNVVEAAIAYARVRTDYQRATLTEKAEAEAMRTRKHDVLIDACNALSRAQNGNGEDNSWWADLVRDRKRVGDFACHLHAILGILAR